MTTTSSSISSSHQAPLSSTLVESDPLDPLPFILRDYAVQLSTGHGLEPTSAILAVLLGGSAAIGKGLHIRSRREQVSPNLYGLHCCPSGGGKKDFSRPTGCVTTLLRLIEHRSQVDAAKAKKDLAALERNIERETGKQFAQAPEQMKGPAPTTSPAQAPAPSLAAMEQRREELQKLLKPRHLALGEDFTPQFVARTISSPGQGAACIQTTSEGGMFFSKIAPTRPNDPGYASLYTNSFNDPSYILSRVDDGGTHHSVENPRITLSVAIQPDLLGDAVRAGNTPIGLFQRFIYTFSDGSTSSIADTMFPDEDVENAAEERFKAVCEGFVEQFWTTPGTTYRLQLTPEAMERIRERVREYEVEKDSILADAPTRAEYLARRPELLLKILQVVHAFQYPDLVAMIGAQDPKAVIALETVDNAIALLDHLFEGNIRFFETFIRERNRNEGYGSNGSQGSHKAGKEEIPFADRVWKKVVELVSRNMPDGVDMSTLQKNLGRYTAKEIWEVIEADPERFNVATIGTRGKVVIRPCILGSDVYQPTDTANVEAVEVAKSKPRSKVVMDFGEIGLMEDGTNTAQSPVHEAPGASGAQYEGVGESYDIDELAALWDDAACGGYPTPEPKVGHGEFASLVPSINNQTEARKL